jgi:regulator of nucleoside diphosphate kinase
VNNNISITREDFEKLQELVDGLRATAAEGGIDAAALEDELGRAEIVDRDSIPPDVITMNSEVCLEDLDTGKIARYRLVWPHVRQLSGPAAPLSVLAPLGMALLGYREGDVIEWSVPRGIRRVRVMEVVGNGASAQSAA